MPLSLVQVHLNRRLLLLAPRPLALAAMPRLRDRVPGRRVPATTPSPHPRVCPVPVAPAVPVPRAVRVPVALVPRAGSGLRAPVVPVLRAQAVPVPTRA